MLNVMQIFEDTTLKSTFAPSNTGDTQYVIWPANICSGTRRVLVLSGGAALSWDQRNFISFVIICFAVLIVRCNFYQLTDFICIADSHAIADN